MRPRIKRRSKDAYKQSAGQAYDKKVMFANRVIEKFGNDQMAAFIKNPAVANNPGMIEMLSKLGEQLFSEDDFQGSDKIRGAMTPAEARSKRNAIMADSGHPYWNAAHPSHQAAIQEVNKLIEMENPS
jgi:hypothetical protein